jgi:sigma-B regulation protein RsbU (phosphoserine phosphatase)
VSRKNKPLRRLSERRCAGRQRQSLAAVGSLPELLRAFRRATGWALCYTPGSKTAKPAFRSRPKRTPDTDPAAVGSESSGVTGYVWSAPVSPGVGDTPGQLALAPLDPEPEEKSHPASNAPAARQDERVSGPRGWRASERQRQPGAAQDRLELGAARELASAIGGMLSELLDARRALWQREAELAARTPLTPHPEEPAHLAVRLEAVLKGGAEAVGAQAAALYLLDDATTELKLRACWGLPFDRLTAPARPLRGALADLEALLGHAVVLDDPQAMRHWRAAEDFPAAVCLPVATAANLLGTLWVFSDKKRDFTDTQTNILEIVAGRVAVELEREILLHENLQLSGLKRQLAAASRLRRKLLPKLSPLVDGWQIAGCSSAAPAVLYDWFCLGDNHLAFAIVEALDAGIAGAISAAAIRALVRAHLQYHHDVQAAIERINLTHWTGSAGDQHATLLLGMIDVASGEVDAAMAGDGTLLCYRNGRCQPLLQPTQKLGEGPQLQYRSCHLRLEPGEVLLAAVPGLPVRSAEHRLPELTSRLAELLANNSDLPARQLAALAQKCLSEQPSGSRQTEQTLVAIKRTGAAQH